MEDIAPLLIFIVIALVNLFKFLAEKGGKKKPGQPGKPAPKLPAGLEDLFRELSGKTAPPPFVPEPDWPDEPETEYMEDVEEFEPPAAAPAPYTPEPVMEPVFLQHENPVPYKPHGHVTSSAFAGISSMRLPPVPLMRSNSAGRIDYDLKDRKQLKKAVLASLIFSPPRACDATFDTTPAK